jgi:DNA topoisomerase I
MSLLIVESPAKCSKIQGFLGPGWRVIATMGHIRALEEDIGAIGLERDFEARYHFIKEKAKAIAQIKEAAAKATTVYLASDDDREGEAISYSVAVLLKLNVATTPRAVFHEITKEAVTAAVANPRRIDMNRVNAQQARAVLDMMVGFTISPLLWKYVGHSLSAGRCQTPALRILVDKETAIEQFQASTAWRVKGSWSNTAAFAASKPLEASKAFEAAMTEDLEDQESAENYMENLCEEPNGTITAVATKPTTESPPSPLITSTLQQEASASMSIQPKNAMKIAQRLYEAGHITYMRTDSPVLSEEAKTAARAWVTEAFGQEFLAEAPQAGGKKPLIKKSKAEAKPQEAHEAIRPTHIETRTLPADEDWSAVDRKLYTLIWNRAVQSVMAVARGETRTVEFLAAGDPMEFPWKAQWKRQTFAGWRKIGAAATDLDADDDQDADKEAEEATWAAATALKVGDSLTWSSMEAWPHTSKPSPRHTEATLVRELEKRGIGRPSTFAALVGTLIDKNYAEKKDASREVVTERLKMSPGVWPPASTKDTKRVSEKQKLVPTALGRSVLEFCLREFEQLFAYDFTRDMETRLDLIAVGEQPWKDLCRDTWTTYKERYEALKAGKATVAAAASRERLFLNGIKAVQSKKGPLLLKEGATKEDAAIFYGWPVGKAFGEITQAEVTTFVATKEGGGEVGTYEGKPITKKSGPFGTYATCDGVNVPVTAEDTEETIQAKFAAKKQAFLHRLGPFEFRNGPYGVFMFKPELTGKARKFVSLPTGVDPKTLTQEATVRLYQAGLKTKATAGAYGKKKNTN